MRQHSFYPQTFPTVPSRRRQFMRFARWLALFLVVMAMVLGVIAVIHKLHTVDAHIDSAFSMGMKAGFDMCGVGER